MSEEQEQAVLLIKTEQTEIPLAIPVEIIEELTRIETKNIHPVPRSKPLFQGITLLRNQTIPVISLERLLFKNHSFQENSKPKKSLKTKLPVIIVNNNGIRAGFSFEEVLKYSLIQNKAKLPQKIIRLLQYPDYSDYYEIKEDKKKINCLYINLLGIMKQFIEVKEETPRISSKTEKKEELDFDLDQFTIKEGEEFDPSKIKF